MPTAGQDILTQEQLTNYTVDCNGPDPGNMTKEQGRRAERPNVNNVRTSNIEQRSFLPNMNVVQHYFKKIIPLGNRSQEYLGYNYISRKKIIYAGIVIVLFLGKTNFSRPSYLKQ